MKKFVSVIIALTLVLSLCPAALADGGMTYSDKLVGFIEEFEGYEQNQYEDPKGSGNYYIGYGTKCDKDAYPDGITQAEAEQMLRDYLDAKVLPDMNNFLTQNSVSLSQNQFDALCSFTYNLGSGWMTGTSRLHSYLVSGIQNYTPAQIVDAIGVFGHQLINGQYKVVDGLVNRRIREARLFVYGDYTGTSSPEYCWLIIDRAGGELENDIFCYEKDKPYGTLPQPTKSGEYFTGWLANETGAVLKDTDAVSSNLHAAATWSTVETLPYTDVPENAWYRAAVTYCYKNGLMDGLTSTAFAPGVKMNRAMLVTVLWRMAGKPVVNYAMPFTDVPGDTWYTEAVRWAASEGIVTGVSATAFAPLKDVSREQLVTLIYRFEKQQGKMTDQGAAMGLAGYGDAGAVSEYAYSAFEWAVNAGVVKGSQGADGTMLLTPKATASRSQVAQILQNLGSLS